MPEVEIVNQLVKIFQKLESGVSASATLSNDDLNFLKTLFSENINIEYDSAGNISKLSRTTKDPLGNTITISYSFSYDSEGNLIGISKEVS